MTDEIFLTFVLLLLDTFRIQEINLNILFHLDVIGFIALIMLKAEISKDIESNDFYSYNWKIMFI